LQPYIECFRIVESASCCVNRILPGVAQVIALRLKGWVSYLNGKSDELLPAFSISGLRNTPRLIQYGEGAVNLLIQFRPGGLNGFLKMPAHTLFNESLPLGCVFAPDSLARLEDQLGEALDIKACIAAAEQFLLSHLSVQQDHLIWGVTKHIQDTGGILSIRELAAAFYISHDALEKRFRKMVGTSPKQFASLVRLKNITQLRAPKPDFTEMALNAGFFDQAHFNKAFKQFTGQTPRDWFKAPPLW